MSDINLKTITFPQIGNKYLLGDPTLSISGTGADAKATGDALATKANTDGSYESMTVGNAEQLVSNVRVNDKTPYLFRTSGGSVDIGDREYVNGIVGGTVAWNQYANKGIGIENVCTKTYDSSTGITTITPTGYTSNYVGLYNLTSGAERIAGHKYFISIDAYLDSTATIDFGYGANTAKQISGGIWTNVSTIQSWSSASLTFYVRVAASGWSSETFKIKNVMTIDLTQLFGSTIADYIYSLEQANAGAGIAWFKKLFPKPYYAYNAGELKHVSGLVSHDMTGFNQFDKSTAEVGGLSGDGTKSSNTNYKISQYIECVPNTTYYFKNVASNYNSHSVGWYDADKNFIQYNDFQGTATADEKSGTKISPSNARYMRVACYKDAIDRVNVNISWDGSRDGEYEPYELHSYPLDSDLTLRGIPKLDANNSLYYDGDVYESDGTVTRKYGIVDLGTLTWSKNDGESVYYAKVSGGKNQDDINALTNAPYTYIPRAQASSDKIFKIVASGYDAPTAYFRNDTVSTIADFVNAVNGKYLVYELATPTTETADPYQATQIVNDFGTEEYVIDSDTFAVPVGHDTDYPIDLKAKVEMAPNSPDGDGDYIVRQTNGMNEYVPLVIEDALPTIPSTAGTYKLTVTVTEGSDPVLAWTQA